jgi:hypothetical protein
MVTNNGNLLAALTLRLVVPAEADEGLDDSAVPASIQFNARASWCAPITKISKPEDFRLDALLAPLDSIYSVLLRRSAVALAKLIFGTAAMRDLVGVVAFLIDPGVLVADWGRLPGRPLLYSTY